MPAYYLAPALATLRAEIDARWPDRDRASDGWIGDAAHRATKSDHNPNARGAVCALDVDRDGIDVPAILAAIEAHPSAHYWIFNRQIADADTGWQPRPYAGSNPHDKHLHVSIRQTRTAEQDTRPWLEDEMTPAQFLAILDDPKVAAKMRALPWQYTGGGIPAKMNALNVLNEIVLTGRTLGEALARESSNPEEIRALLRELPAPPSAGQVADEVLAGLGGRSPADVAQALVAAGQDPGALAAELTALAGQGQARG